MRCLNRCYHCSIRSLGCYTDTCCASKGSVRDRRLSDQSIPAWAWPEVLRLYGQGMEYRRVANPLIPLKVATTKSSVERLIKGNPPYAGVMMVTSASAASSRLFQLPPMSLKNLIWADILFTSMVCSLLECRCPDGLWTCWGEEDRAWLYSYFLQGELI